jgi:hypothetical protein
MDPLANHFLRNIVYFRLSDVKPITHVATWRNIRTSNEGITIKLNRYLVSEKSLDKSNMFRPCVGHWGF